jgi:YD repeat-containing protein
MSQATQLPPPPIGPKSEFGHPLRYLVFAVVLIFGLVVAIEGRLLNSAAAKEAANRIRDDARVRADFGGDVHIPFALAVGFGDRVRIYAGVSGKSAQGYARVDLVKLDNGWMISSLEVHNRHEGHLISLAKLEAPAKPEQLQGSGNLYFVALGDEASGDVASLAAFFQKDLGIPVKILPPMSLPGEAYDSNRKQWIAELLAQAMEARYPTTEADPDSKVIGIVEGDLYIYAFNWPLAYSYRHSGQYSVVPTARLDPSFDRFPANPAIRMERLRKIAMKAVGLLYLGFKESKDPQSVDAFEASIDNIDRMGAVYLASDVQTRPRFAKDAFDGTPCLIFSSATLAGAPLSDPILPCWHQGDPDENTQFELDLSRGRFESIRNELYRGGVIPLILQRLDFSYHFDDRVRAFGKSSWQSLDDSVWSADPASIQTINVYGTLFQRITPGTGFSPKARYRGSDNASDFSGALLSWENGGWRIDTPSGAVWRYLGCGPNSPVQCYYMGHKNFRGDSIEVKRDSDTGHIQQVSQKTNPDLPAVAALDHTWTPLYAGDKITEIRDSDGRTARYRYNEQEFLTDVEADSHTIHYVYDDANKITSVTEDGRLVEIHYDSEGRPDRVDLPGRVAYTVKYSQDAIEVNVPGASYTVTVLPTYFRVARTDLRR